MLNFPLGSLRDWNPVATGELLDLDIPPGGHRRVELEVMANSVVEIRVFLGDASWLVGLGEGLMSVSFGIDAPAALTFLGAPDADVYLRSRAVAQTIPESLDPSYTTIEPRPSGPSSEFKRMMMLVELNARRREQALLDELDRRDREALVIEGEPLSPAPVAVPEPEASDDE